MKYGRWNNDEIALLRSIYKEKSKEYIVKTLNRKWKGIVSKANRLGLYHDRAADSKNIEYFDNWSDRMAYVLGFIAADGCVVDSKSNMGFQIHLSKKDLRHLIKIKNELCYSGNISVSDTSCKLSIYSRYLFDKLLERGIHPRKSLDMRFPNIPEQYLSHFVRGYFDGDGCICSYFHKRDRAIKWTSSFVGAKDFLSVLRDMIHKSCNTRLVNVIKVTNKNIYYISYSVKDSIKLEQWMYKDSTIHLDRKYNKFQQLLKERG